MPTGQYKRQSHTEEICDVCGKKFEKVSKECDKCYAKGFDIERKKIKLKAIKWVKEDIENSFQEHISNDTLRWMKRLNIIDDDLE